MRAKQCSSPANQGWGEYITEDNIVAAAAAVERESQGKYCAFFVFALNSKKNNKIARHDHQSVAYTSE